MLERILQLALADQIVAIGPLAADRLADTVGAHLAMIDAARGAEQIACRLAEMLAQEILRLGAQIGPGVDIELRHPLGRFRSDAIEAPHR